MFCLPLATPVFTDRKSRSFMSFAKRPRNLPTLVLESRCSECSGDVSDRSRARIYGEMSRACLFCGVQGTGTLTHEHVVQRWLIAHLALPPDDLMAHAVADSRTGELTHQLRVHSTHNFVEGRVCEDCNCGWMSTLESEAKPIFGSAD
jgi:hypothetical protein